MSKIKFKLTSVMISLAATSCIKANLPKSTTGKLNSLEESNATPMVSFSNPPAMLAEVQKRGYLPNPDCASGLKGSEEVMFATGAVEEIGQASGVTQKVGDKILFIQKASLAKALLFAPGVLRDEYENQWNTSENSNRTGKDRFATIQSTWDVAAYLRLVCRVAFAQDFETTKMYQKFEIGELDGKGGTAGLEIKPEHLLMVKLTHYLHDKETARFKIYFSKTNGPVAVRTEFSDFMDPALGDVGTDNTLNVYINYSGGSGVGGAVTVDPRLKKCQENGGTWDTIFSSEIKCFRRDQTMSKEDCSKIPGAQRRYSSADVYSHCMVPVPYN